MGELEILVAIVQDVQSPVFLVQTSFPQTIHEWLSLTPAQLPLTLVQAHHYNGGGVRGLHDALEGSLAAAPYGPKSQGWSKAPG